MAYLGGLTAIMANLPGVNRITGFVAFLGWRFTYWFLQLSMRNRFMLSTDWLRTLVKSSDDPSFLEGLFSSWINLYFDKNKSFVEGILQTFNEAPLSLDETSHVLDLGPNRHNMVDIIDYKSIQD